MIRLITAELYKIAVKPRSYIGFAAITGIVLLIEIALWLEGKNYLQFMLQSLDQSFDVQGTLLNGNLICFIILQTLIIQMPLLVALVAGDLISGEAASGTIRMLLTRPYSRNSILAAKYIAASVYVMMLIAWLGILAWGGGQLLFGSGDLVVLKSEELVIIQAHDTSWRFIAAFGMAFLSLSVVSAFSLMLSCFTDNSVSPIIAAMTTIILFTIIGTMEVPLFDKIKPFLFTTHMVIWRNLFDMPVDKNLLLHSSLVLLGHIASFLSISFFHFNRKDIYN